MFFLFPSGRINPKAIRAMAELDYDLGTHASEGLERFDGESGDAAITITMGCGDGCPNLRGKQREDWQIPDPREMDEAAFREVRDEIGRRVRKLLARL